jgi:hypothetical protein
MADDEQDRKDAAQNRAWKAAEDFIACIVAARDDGNAYFDATRYIHEADPATLRELLADLDETDIAAALTFYARFCAVYLYGRDHLDDLLDRAERELERGDIQKAWDQILLGKQRLQRMRELKPVRLPLRSGSTTT